MSARRRFWLAVVVLALLMTGPFIVTAALVWLEMLAPERHELARLLLPRMPLGVTLTAAGFAVGLWLLYQLFQQYVQGLLRMAEHLRLMLSVNRSLRVTPGGPPEVRDLAVAANALAEQRDARAAEVEAQIKAAKASVEEEKNRLAALMTELAQAVVVCNRDGAILLYNRRARAQFGIAGTGTAPLGLGRSIYSILARDEVDHALETAERRHAAGKSALASFVTSTRGGQLLRVQLVPVRSGMGEATGYVLSMDNITRGMEQEAARDQVIHDLTEGSRSALGAIRAAIANLHDYPDMDAEQRQHFVRIIEDEASAMSQRLNRTLDQFADSLRARWPLEDALGVDVVAAAARRVTEKTGLNTRLQAVDDSLWIRVDSYQLVFAVAFLAERLRDHYGIRELRFRLNGEGRLARFDLLWRGSNVSPETFYAWELEPMQAGGESTPLTLRDVITRHGGEFWCQREKAAMDACFRFILPVASPPPLGVEVALPEGRPEYYDFDLFARPCDVDLDRPLAQLGYTVFDTETTGLEPTEGDEIIEIGAVRIVNGRLLPQEAFERLVDPHRPVRADSAVIHGLYDEQLQGQPGIETVLPEFHQFAADTVLVGHNVAFDMRFLELKEAALKIAFRQPVLDTLLLSAIVQPHQQSHRLDAVAERFGVTIGTRHRALQDALASAEIFVKLLPLLQEKGIVTLRQALEASRHTYLARIKY